MLVDTSKASPSCLCRPAHHCQKASKQLLVLCASHTERATVCNDCAATIVYAREYRMRDTCCSQAEMWKPLRPKTAPTQPE